MGESLKHKKIKRKIAKSNRLCKMESRVNHNSRERFDVECAKSVNEIDLNKKLNRSILKLRKSKKTKILIVPQKDVNFAIRKMKKMKVHGIVTNLSRSKKYKV